MYQQGALTHQIKQKGDYYAPLECAGVLHFGVIGNNTNQAYLLTR